MRSLTWKLTLAFVLVGVAGAVLVAVLVGQQTRAEFDRFASSRDENILVTALGDYYAATGSWDNVRSMLNGAPPLDRYIRGVTLADANRVTVLGSPAYPAGQVVPDSALATGTAVTANGQVVGYVIPFTNPDRAQQTGPPPPDVLFLRRVAWATAASALIATLTAVVLGILLARTLTRPLRELTAATQAMAGGALDQRVTVRSRDEIGELAASFNHMSADLARASQLRKQMTADLAHDLRTPLSILRGYTEGLQDGRLQGSTTVYTVMHGEVEHLQHLVEDLRLLSLADAGELRLHRRPVDPTALLERTGLAYIVQAQQQGLALRIDAPDNLPSIEVDTDRMTQVLNNLVSNALRHTHAGEIALAAERDGQDVVLRVSDTGTGIPADDLPFVFDRFYRVDKSRQRNDGDASGLGLAIAKALVEAHGGALTVDSAADRGTIFSIRLPAAPHPS